MVMDCDLVRVLFLLVVVVVHCLALLVVAVLPEPPVKLQRFATPIP